MTDLLPACRQDWDCLYARAEHVLAVEATAIRI